MRALAIPYVVIAADLVALEPATLAMNIAETHVAPTALDRQILATLFVETLALLLAIQVPIRPSSPFAHPAQVDVQEPWIHAMSSAATCAKTAVETSTRPCVHATLARPDVPILSLLASVTTLVSVPVIPQTVATSAAATHLACRV